MFERKGFLAEAEYDFLSTDSRLGNNIILLGYGGSHAYGTNLPTSDTDVRGIAGRTAEDILLGVDYENVVEVNTDTVIYTVDKLFSLLSYCNPNCIEILGLRDEDYIYVSDVGREILDNKRIFLSQKCIPAFVGYANQQLYRLKQKTVSALSPFEYNEHIAKTIEAMKDHLEREYELTGIQIRNTEDGLVADIAEQKGISLESFYGLINEISNVLKEYRKNSSRNQKAIEHGKINKHALHLLRLYMMGCDLLEKQEIVTYREEEHDLLMDIRFGKYMDSDGLMNAEFFDIVRSYEERFEKARKSTLLPENPDYEAIDKLRMKINGEIVRK